MNKCDMIQAIKIMANRNEDIRKIVVSYTFKYSLEEMTDSDVNEVYMMCINAQHGIVRKEDVVINFEMAAMLLSEHIGEVVIEDEDAIQSFKVAGIIFEKGKFIIRHKYGKIELRTR